MLRRLEGHHTNAPGTTCSVVGTLIDFLEATVPGSSNGGAMRAPPPQFQPPSPPVDDHQYQRDLMISTLPTDDDDDSHYETPDRHTSLVVGGSILDNRAFHGESSSLITTPLSTALTARPGVSGTMRNGNCYRPPPSLGNEEERHQFLQRNPDTGAYFIPSCELHFMHP